MLGGRTPSMVAREALAPRNYAALARAVRVFPRPGEALGRYFFGRGDYPALCAVRTPLGVKALTLFHPHDMLTVNEVFCRRDYAASGDLRVAVDIGSNIGVSALYFLTRNVDTHCLCFEPVPRNVERLSANLAGFEDRFKVVQAAVADRAGRVTFGVEDTGRYGGIGVATGRDIEVECLEINEVLAGVLEDHVRINVLKLDTEGTELSTVEAIRPEHLRRIDTIYFECVHPVPVHEDLFDAHRASLTVRLRNRERW
jgi:FkbM family methyltransferase